MNNESISLSWIKEYLEDLYIKRDSHARSSMMWEAYNNSICVIQEMLQASGNNYKPGNEFMGYVVRFSGAIGEEK